MHAVLSAVFLTALPAFRLTAQCPDGSPPPCRAARPAASTNNTVAVLYFDNRSRDSSDAYLAEGLTEAIIAKLGELPRLTVKSRFVVRRYQGSAAQANPATIGRSLGVTYLVTGSVQRSGNRLRVTAEMSRAASGDRVWGQQYERGDGDVFAIQEDIARGVATGVAGRLLPEEAAGLAARPTRSNAAYDHLLRGDVLVAQRTQAATLRALAEYGAAVRLDPGLASGWARIGLASGFRLDWGWGDGSAPPDSILTYGLAAADRALGLDSSNSDAWMAHGYLMIFRNPRDFAGAEEGLRRAIALNPRNAEAMQQLADVLDFKRAGHPAPDSIYAELTTLYRRALEVEPGRPTTMRKLAYTMPVGAARLAIVDSALALDPASAVGLVDRSTLLAAMGDSAGARTAMRRAEQVMDPGFAYYGGAMLAFTALRLRDTVEARTRARRLVRDLPPAGRLHRSTGAILARVLRVIGDSALALEVLERTAPGVTTWAQGVLFQFRAADLADPRLRRVWEANRPPWVRP